MDVNALRIAVTLLSFVAFIGIVAFAWSRRHQTRFTEAAELPFHDSPPLDDHGDQHPSGARP